MRKEEFARILQSALAGDNEALEIILRIYDSLIKRHCYIDDTLDEDLRQYIWLYIAKNISRFPM